MNSPFASVVIPTLGRPTLTRSLLSLQQQTYTDYEALVINDAQAQPWKVTNNQVRSLHPAPPITGSAGLLRNEGIQQAQGEWIAFLDDDDTLAPRYLEHLHDHAHHEYEPDVVVFRMVVPRTLRIGVQHIPFSHHTIGPWRKITPLQHVVPTWQNPQLAYMHVGISYAVRRSLAQTMSFIAEDIKTKQHEDIDFLLRLQQQGAKILLSPYADYQVNDTVCSRPQVTPTVLGFGGPSNDL